MSKDKFLNLLGICRKAGKISTGAKKATEAIKLGKAKAIFVASDLSKKTQKELEFTAKDLKLAVVRTGYTIEQLSHAIGIPAGVLAILDEGFATALNNQIEGGTRFDD